MACRGHLETKLEGLCAARHQSYFVANRWIVAIPTPSSLARIFNGFVNSKRLNVDHNYAATFRNYFHSYVQWKQGGLRPPLVTKQIQ